MATPCPDSLIKDGGRFKQCKHFSWQDNARLLFNAQKNTHLQTVFKQSSLCSQIACLRCHFRQVSGVISLKPPKQMCVPWYCDTPGVSPLCHPLPDMDTSPHTDTSLCHCHHPYVRTQWHPHPEQLSGSAVRAGLDRQERNRRQIKSVSCTFNHLQPWKNQWQFFWLLFSYAHVLRWLGWTHPDFHIYPPLFSISVPSWSLN